MGKSTISTGPFSIAFCMFTRPGNRQFRCRSHAFGCYFLRRFDGLGHGMPMGDGGALMGFPNENGDGFTIEIVDLPINSMVIFHSYVKVYQRVKRSLFMD